MKKTYQVLGILLAGAVVVHVDTEYRRQDTGLQEIDSDANAKQERRQPGSQTTSTIVARG